MGTKTAPFLHHFSDYPSVLAEMALRTEIASFPKRTRAQQSPAEAETQKPANSGHAFANPYDKTMK